MNSLRDTHAAFQMNEANLNNQVIQRVGQSGLSQNAFVIQELINIIERDPDTQCIYPSTRDLGFVGTVDARSELHKFLNLLKERGCFAAVERIGNRKFSISTPNLKVLKRELNRATGANSIFKKVHHFLESFNSIRLMIESVLAIVISSISLMQGAEIKVLQFEIDGLSNQNEILKLENLQLKSELELQETSTTDIGS